MSFGNNQRQAAAGAGGGFDLQDYDLNEDAMIDDVMETNDTEINNNYYDYDNDDDDTEILKEIDPFEVEAYKIKHFPGWEECKGRNILDILNDRTMFGSTFRNKLFYTGKGEKKLLKKRKSQSSAGDNNNDKKGGVDEKEKGGSANNEKQVQFNTPCSSPTRTPPPNNILAAPPDPQTPLNLLNYTGGGNQNNPTTPTPIGTPTNNFSTPQQQHSQQPQSTPTNNNNTSNNNNQTRISLKLPPNEVLNITNEITSYAEYASATKFEANYLNHLNGGEPIPRRPGQIRRGDNDGYDDNDGGGTGNSPGGRSNRGRLSNEGGGGPTTQAQQARTQNQQETDRLLREHLRGGTNSGSRMQSFLNPSRPRPPDAATIAAAQQQLSDTRRQRNQIEYSLQGAQQEGNTMSDRTRASLQADIEALRREERQHETNLRMLQQRLPQHPVGAPGRGGGGSDRGNNNNNRPPNAQPPPPQPAPTPSVSTISVAFSPDNKSLASTHGDHTIKISCTHTGKLIRTLEGHPRTPWTVKYHPTNARIVASGCLGFQVRVWDWNYQKESVRKVRKTEKERKWKGRYDMHSRERSNEWGGVDSIIQGMSDRGSSPRGVVEGWKMKLGDGVTDDAANNNEDGTVCHNITTLDEEDDYAASILTATGIPHDDPAWYETESEIYNYDDGIGVCLNMIRLNSAVISLSFHPSGEVLAMASGSTLHLWDYNEEKRKRHQKALAASAVGVDITSKRESDARILDRSDNSDFPRTQTMDFRHESALRCVHFPPCGKIIIIGGVNPQSSNEGLPSNRPGDPRKRGGMSGGGMSFHLRMWDFSLDAVLDPNPAVGVGGRPRGGKISDEGHLHWNYNPVKEAMRNVSFV